MQRSSPYNAQSCVLTASPSAKADLMNAPFAAAAHSSILPGSGTLLLDKANCIRKAEDIELFDLEIPIDLKQIEPRDVNAAVENISSLIGPRLGRSGASIHIHVEPVVD